MRLAPVFEFREVFLQMSRIIEVNIFLRYTKYMYPMECKLNNLSNPMELQSIIEGKHTYIKV